MYRLIMKTTTLLLITLFFLLQSCKSQENLYILFDNNSKFMKKVRMSRDEPYNYNFIFDKNIDLNLTSNFYPQTITEKTDTFQVGYLKKIKLKDYIWLKNFVSKYKHPNEIHFTEIYKELYVVEIDSINNKVIISKVRSTTYED